MKSAFSFWETNGKLIFSQENVKVFRLEKHDYLFVDQTMYASTQERDWYIKNLAPWVNGSVLEIGLGLGCASKVMLASPKIKSLLTIEANPNVISAYGKSMYRSHSIILADVYKWVQEIPKDYPLFDLIFVDHYTLGDEEVIHDLQSLKQEFIPLLKGGGKMIFWVDENCVEEEKKQVRDLWVV